MNTKNTKGKVAVKSETVKEVKQTEPVAQPVVEVKQTQKGGKKSKQPVTESVKVSEPVVQAQVVEAPTPEPVVQAQKGGKKSSKKAQAAEPVVQVSEPVPVPVSVPEPVPVVQAQKGGKKSSKKTVEPVAQAQAEPTPTPVAQPAPKVEVEAEAEGEGEAEADSEGKLRYFKLFYNDEYQGRYCGKKPKQAANKAFSSIIKDMKKNGNQQGGVNVDINFSIRECTRNSRHKEYNYVGLREQLQAPVEVKIKNEDGSVKEIVYSFHNKISKAPKVQA